MTPAPRELLNAYISRRSPWGPPWWVYGVTFGAANLIRQAAIMLSPADIPNPVRVASWVATVLLTLGLVNGVALVVRRWSRPARLHAIPAMSTARPAAAPDEKAA
jgi:hypothetical protein